MSAANAAPTFSSSPQANQASTEILESETRRAGSAPQDGSGQQAQQQYQGPSSYAHQDGMNGRETQAESHLAKWPAESSSAQRPSLTLEPAAMIQDGHASSPHYGHGGVASSTTPTLLESNSSGGRAVENAGMVQDPEDWWEDEDTEEEDVEGNTLIGTSTEDGERRSEAASYKAAMREYRQSKRALMRSNNLSIFASVDGSDADAASSSGATEVGDPTLSDAQHRRSRSGSRAMQINGSSSPRRSSVNGLGLLHDDGDVMRGRYPDVKTEAEGQRRHGMQSQTPKTESE